MVITIAAAIGLAVVSGCDRDGLAPISGYRPPAAGSRALVLQVRVGPNDRVKTARVVRENGQSVEVEVAVRVDDHVSSDLSVLKNVTVTLKEPLGARRVLDSDQTVIPTLRPIPSSS